MEYYFIEILGFKVSSLSISIQNDIINYHLFKKKKTMNREEGR